MSCVSSCVDVKQTGAATHFTLQSLQAQWCAVSLLSCGFQGDEHKSTIANGLPEVLGLSTQQTFGVEYGSMPPH